MMYCKRFYAFTLFAAVVLMTGCHSKIDLVNIDPKAEVEVGVALPVGSIKATIGDFLGGDDVEQIYLDEEGIFHFMSNIKIPTKDYHTIDLSKYVLENKKAQYFDVKSAIDDQTLVKKGEQYVLTYDLKLSTANFNTDPSKERIDRIQIAEANFKSIFNVYDFGLSWSEIEKIELILGDQFEREAGKKIAIPTEGYKFKQEIPITIDHFTLDITDPKGGTVDKVKFKVKFYVRPKEDIPVTDDSQMSYELKVSVLKYEAAWGYFQAGDDMRDSQRLNLDSLWDEWQSIKKLKVRFMEPVINMNVWHKISAPLLMNIDYIRAIDSEGNKTAATWDGSEKYSFKFTNNINPNTTNFNDSVVNSQEFSFEASKGHLDKLFDVRPDFFEYSFYLQVDKNARDDYPWSQHRITTDARIQGEAQADVPFKLNTGSEMEYTTTLSDVDISSISLDSLLASAQILDSLKASEVKLILEIENGLPFKIEGQFTFLNKDSVDMHLQLFEENEDNHLIFDAPKMERGAGQKYGTVVQGSSVTRLIVNVDKNDFDRLSEVGYIRFDAAMLDNPEPCCITKKDYLRIRIGIGAHVDAVLNFANNNEENKQ